MVNTKKCALWKYNSRQVTVTDPFYLKKSGSKCPKSETRALLKGN
jgi:hypothetical protein